MRQFFFSTIFGILGIVGCGTSLNPAWYGPEDVPELRHRQSELARAGNEAGAKEVQVLIDYIGYQQRIKLEGLPGRWKQNPPLTSATNIGIGNCEVTAKLELPRDIAQVLEAVVNITAGSSSGTGFIVSDEGYILTAAHVTSRAAAVGVQLRSGLTFRGNVLATDKAQDIALIKIPGKGHSCLRLKLDARGLQGSEVFAVGTPSAPGMPLPFTVTKGVVSAYRVRATDGVQYIQTDAAINYGNSGGPLLNAQGQVVGIVSKSIVGLGVEGLSFGIPPQVVAKSLGISWQ